MKYIVTSLFILSVLSACQKAETQYKDQDNKKETVNDGKSDTIRTLKEISDTMHQKKDTAKVINGN